MFQREFCMTWQLNLVVKDHYYHNQTGRVPSDDFGILRSFHKDYYDISEFMFHANISHQQVHTIIKLYYGKTMWSDKQNV